MEEIWKDIKGFEGRYQISNKGRVKSLNYSNRKYEKILTNVVDGKGYYAISLGRGVRKSVHRIVAEHFLPEDLERKYVNHKNGIPKDNRVENLEWCTPSENMQHKIYVLGYKYSKETLEKMSISAKKRGVSENTRLARYKKVINIETGKEYVSQVSAAKDTGVSNNYISYHCLKKNSKKWRFA